LHLVLCRPGSPYLCEETWEVISTWQIRVHGFRIAHADRLSSPVRTARNGSGIGTW
jgi:hypothetical protein